MILADGGVVCIDEFDKMREGDRVAIHEAMEQQTISIAKAGITTILNSRTSVLAAANPVYGHYDESKSSAENIDFLPTILSRFDLVFIIRDIRDEERDKLMARHVLNMHKNSGGQNEVEGVFSVDTLKKYISYCRQTIAPHLSLEASNTLINNYVTIRDNIRSVKEQEMGAATIPITVRQLEAIIRISESLAKMELKAEAGSEHVSEAIRLFHVSTINAANSGVIQNDTLSTEMRNQVQKAEDAFNRRLMTGSKVSVAKLLADLEGIVKYILKIGTQSLCLTKSIADISAKR